MVPAPLITLERLRAYPLFAPLPESTLIRLQMHVREEQFPKGTTVLRAGTYNTDAYYITEGYVEVRLPTAQAVAAVRPGPSRAADPGLLSRLAGMLGIARSSPPAPTPARRNQAGSQAEAASAELPVISRPIERTVVAAEAATVVFPQRQAEPRASAPALVSSEGATVVLANPPIGAPPGDNGVLSAGETFGESSAISRYPAATDVIAMTDTRCLLISRYALTTILFKHPALADFKKSVQDRYRSRTLGTHLRQISLFADLSPDLIAQITEQAELVEFDPEDLMRLKGDQREEAKRRLMAGVCIAEEGKPGDSLYLVVGGHVKVSVRAGTADLAVTYLRKGDYAGELCLLMDEAWPFSLSALEHVEMVKLSRHVVQDIIKTSPEAERQLWETAVKRLKQRGFARRAPHASRQMQMAMDTGLIHGESVLLIDLSTCTRCDDCVRACADAHDGTPRFVREGLRHEQWNVIAACYQCTDPVCMVNCPTGAITRALGTLEVTINDQICVGCEACAKSCPWDNIVMVPNQAPSDFTRNYSANKSRKVLDSASTEQQAEWQREPATFINEATKCDLCADRRAGPACVQICPQGAAVRVSFKDIESVASRLNRK